MVDTLNNDCLIHILSWLPTHDKIKSSQVCKRWYNINRYVYTEGEVKFNFHLYESNSGYKAWFDHYGKYICNMATTMTYFDAHRYLETLHSSSFLVHNLYRLDLIMVATCVDQIHFEIFQNLKILTVVSNSSFSDLTFISSLKGLTHLTIENCGLKTIDGVEGFTRLRYLKLCKNEIVSIPSSIGELRKSLESLDISGNDARLKSLPPAFYTLVNLKYLKISSVAIDSRLFPQFIRLKTLVAMKCSFTDSHNVFGTFTNLETLILAFTRMVNFPKSILALEKLKILNMGYTNIGNLPSKINRLKNLVVLNVKNCELIYIHKNVTKLPKLETLDASENYINTIPTSMYHLHTTRLNLSSNLIEKVSEKIQQWEKMEHLDLSSNLIRYLPEGLKGLCTLKSLNLSHNDLKYISPSLAGLDRLECCNLRGNEDLIVNGLVFDTDIFEVDYDNLID